MERPTPIRLLMEFMGLHTPGSSFVNPGTPLRDAALTAEAAKRALRFTALGNEYTPVGRMVDERSIVNAVVGLNATGGSTNHTLHLIAIAAAAGHPPDLAGYFRYLRRRTIAGTCLSERHG